MLPNQISVFVIKKWSIYNPYPHLEILDAPYCIMYTLYCVYMIWKSHFQPGLAKAQERNKPEYIQKLEKERLIQEGILKVDAQGLCVCSCVLVCVSHSLILIISLRLSLAGDGPASKRPRQSHPDRLERAGSTVSLPELPNDFKSKQVCNFGHKVGLNGQK